MKPSKDKRIVYWNRTEPRPPEEVHEWYFLIINEPKMIERIKGRLFEHFKPVDEIVEYRNNTITGQDLRALCLSFETPESELRKEVRQGVYKGQWKKDNELYRRPGLDSLINRRIKEVTGKTFK